MIEQIGKAKMEAMSQFLANLKSRPFNQNKMKPTLNYFLQRDLIFQGSFMNHITNIF